MSDDEGLPPVVATAKGHPNIRASHAKTVELTEDADVTASGTCIVGIDCSYDGAALAALRGAVRFTFACDGLTDSLTARINPLFRHGDPLIIRRNPSPAPRALAIGATKGSSDLDRELVAALGRSGAELCVTIETIAGEEPAAGTVFVVGMPIGNEADISLRALDILQSVDLVAAEDTRTLKAFLDRHGIRVRTVSYHDHNERARTDMLIERLAAGDRLALVSEAGMPMVSDPGFHLVRAAREAGFLVTVVPGPDSVSAALAVAGIPPNDFRFIGFLPRKKGARQRELEALRDVPYTSVFFEAPHRILETLDAVASVMPDRLMAVCRNLTKFGENVFRGNAEEVRRNMEAEGEQRGELVVVLSAAAPRPSSEGGEEISPDLLTMSGQLLNDGVPTKTIATALSSAANIDRRAAYDVVVRLKSDGDR